MLLREQVYGKHLRNTDADEDDDSDDFNDDEYSWDNDEDNTKPNIASISSIAGVNDDRNTDNVDIHDNQPERH